jgi:hypothetical protein
VLPALIPRIVRGWPLRGAFEGAFVVVLLGPFCNVVSGDSSWVRRVTVAVVHVDAEVIAALTTSACACDEVMLVIN